VRESTGSRRDQFSPTEVTTESIRNRGRWIHSM
jgi:hypothetical protein